jgi:poly(hydroxyalkanoate) depolymerase family esterase
MHAWLEHSVAALRRWRGRLPGRKDVHRVLTVGMAWAHSFVGRLFGAVWPTRRRRGGHRRSRVESAVADGLSWLRAALRGTVLRARAAWPKMHDAGRHRIDAAVALLSSVLWHRGAPIWIEGVYRRRRSLGRRLTRPAAALRYRLYVPSASAQEPLPLLVMLHGCNQDAETFAAGTRMNQLAERRGFAVLYPEQSNRLNALRCWNWFRARDAQSEGESGLIAEMIANVCAEHAIEPRRIYVAGMSAGAAMARVLTARHGALFAACGLHSGVMYGAAASAAQVASTMKHGSAASPEATARALAAAFPGDEGVVPTIAIHGTADRLVNPLNLAQLAEQLLAFADSGNVRPGTSPHTEKIERIGGRVCTVREYERGGRLYLRSCLIEGLGHAWSGGDAAYPFNDDAGPCASELIWDFVSQHSRDERRAHTSSPVAVTRALRA